jgi:hypothetical protein
MTCQNCKKPDGTCGTCRTLSSLFWSPAIAAKYALSKIAFNLNKDNLDFEIKDGMVVLFMRDK